MSQAAPIRPGTLQDLTEIVRIINRAYLAEAFCVLGDRTDADDIRERFEQGHFLVVDDPVAPGRLIGCVFYSVSASRGYLGLLTVDPDAQGQGLSPRLINAVADACREAGCSFVDITVINVRKDLFPFYARWGFAPYAVEVFPRPERMRMPLQLVRLAKPLFAPSDLPLAQA